VDTLTKYGFDSALEYTLVNLVAKSEAHWGSLGRHLDPAMFAERASGLIIAAVQSISDTTGSHPADTGIIVQRIRDWAGDKRVDIKQELLDQATAILAQTKLGPVEAVQCVDAVLHTIKDKRRYAVTQDVLSRYATGADFLPILDAVSGIDSIGVGDVTSSMSGDDGFDALIRMQGLKRIMTGTVELDAPYALNGGLPRGGLGLLVGGSGSGKSIGLSEFAAAGIRQGYRTALISLELPKEWIYARTVASIIGWTDSQIMQFPVEAKLAAKHACDWSLLKVVRMEGGTTPVMQAVSWLRKNGPFDLVIVDYLDLLCKSSKDDQLGDYAVGGYVTKMLRAYAEEADCALWSASQAIRRGNTRAGGKASKHQPLTLDDVAGSMHKIRIADVVLGLNTFDDVEGKLQLMVSGLKHRLGRSGFTIGPVAPNYAIGQILPNLFLYTPPEGFSESY